MFLVFIIVICVIALGYWVFMSPFSQVFGKYPWRVKTNSKVVAITFDDGPNEPYTTQIADFLNQKKVQATFFEVGACIQKYPAVTKRLHKDGHVIGNHSTHHSFKQYFLHPSFRKEITDNQQIIAGTIGQTPKLFRSPWLWRQPWLLRTLRLLRLQPVSGKFCHSLEVLQPSAERIAKATIAKVKPGSIIIFHDGFDAKGGNRARTVQAVKLTVEELIKQGYSFVTVDKLLKVQAYLD